MRIPTGEILHAYYYNHANLSVITKLAYPLAYPLVFPLVFPPAWPGLGVRPEGLPRPADQLIQGLSDARKGLNPRDMF